MNELSFAEYTAKLLELVKLNYSVSYILEWASRVVLTNNSERNIQLDDKVYDLLNAMIVTDISESSYESYDDDSYYSEY